MGDINTIDTLDIFNMDPSINNSISNFTFGDILVQDSSLDIFDFDDINDTVVTNIIFGDITTVECCSIEFINVDDSNRMLFDQISTGNIRSLNDDVDIIDLDSSPSSAIDITISNLAMKNITFDSSSDFIELRRIANSTLTNISTTGISGDSSIDVIELDTDSDNNTISNLDFGNTIEIDGEIEVIDLSSSDRNSFFNIFFGDVTSESDDVEGFDIDSSDNNTFSNITFGDYTAADDDVEVFDLSSSNDNSFEDISFGDIFG